MKTALITGATRGIGRALAFSLAKRGYEIHFIGRNDKSGEAVLNELRKINPEGEHELFLLDLSLIKANKEFLNEYTKNYMKLDLLVLNANPLPKNLKITEEGHDEIFGVGYLSRYMFSVALNGLLSKSKISRVMHMGDARILSKIQFDQIKNPTYSALKALLMSYSASAQITYFLNKNGLTDVPHEFMYPGLVATNQTKEKSAFAKKLSKAFGMSEPVDAGEIIAKHIDDVDSKDCKMKYYDRLKETKIQSKIAKRESEFEQLLDVSVKMTGFAFKK